MPGGPKNKNGESHGKKNEELRVAEKKGGESCQGSGVAVGGPLTWSANAVRKGRGIAKD